MASRLTVVLVSLLVATPVVVFWLWLVILAASAAILCPEACWCGSAGYYVDCSSSGLNNIPLIFPTDVRVLNLVGNNFTSLEKDSFISRGLTELEELDVDSCGLATLELGAFNGLTKLTYLTIWRNRITEIIPGTFEPMSSLEHLILSYNRIEDLQVDIFSGLNNLKHINLDRNKLQYLHPDLFVGLPNLEALNLEYNPVLQIPTDRHFINSHSLSRLDISHCNVSSASVETFANVTALKRLDLSYNNLRSVDINTLEVLPKLSALSLGGNPLQCDCQLQEVWRWCQDHNIETAFGILEPQCDTPSEVQGMRWGVLEKGQCLQGNIRYYGDYENTSYSSTSTEDTYTHTDTDMYTDTETDTDTDTYYDRLDFLKKVEVPLYVVPFIFGTTGNVILLIIITCNKDMRTVPNMYILNLVISDMIYLIVHFAESCGDRISNTWKEDDFTCRFFPFCRRLSVGLSAYSVAVLSIQRYRVTVNPLHVRVSSQPTWRATVIRICEVWIVAALFAIPSALSKDLCQECEGPHCLTYHKNVVIFELLVSCVLPLCVIAFSYIMTARHLLKSARPISEDTQSPQLSKRTNTARIVLGLTVVFLLSYVPYHAYWTYFIFSKPLDPDEEFFYEIEEFKTRKRYIYLVSSCLLLINPCFNPVALFCTSPAFRGQLKRYFVCRFKVKSPVTNFELTRRN